MDYTSFTIDRCLLSHPALPHTVSLQTGKASKNDCFVCGDEIVSTEEYYCCSTCDMEFHFGCFFNQKKLIHPYHPQHPLTLTHNDRGTEEKCTWCGSYITGRYYRCSICSFCLDQPCSFKIPPLTITNPNSHHHSLSFFPRPLLVPCDACGLIDRSIPSFACFQCNYMVHWSCTNLPRVIKITRHQHRLTHTPYLPLFSFSSCRICYKNVDIKYGQYSCNIEGCCYVAHSKCATHEGVWDGRELEWEPEEPDEDIAPFKKIDVDLIKYFCHDHLLRLHKYEHVRDVDKQCQVCVFRIDSDKDFYNCIQCDFSLHEVCANLPLRLDHALHNHPLVLHPPPLNAPTSCSACLQSFSGFRYKCTRKSCLAINKKFQVDVRCVLVPDYFTHKSHEHPLFIPIPVHNSKYKRHHKKKIICKGCQGKCKPSHLQCTKCEFVLCYRCATLPDEVYYKHDEHLLSLCHGESSDGKYWCEVCEKQVDSTKWFYTCNKCCITIHLGCILGSSIYMKSGFTFDYRSYKVTVLRNNSTNRPICLACHQHSLGYVYYNVYDHEYEVASCSLECLPRSRLFLSCFSRQ